MSKLDATGIRAGLFNVPRRQRRGDRYGTAVDGVGSAYVTGGDVTSTNFQRPLVPPRRPRPAMGTLFVAKIEFVATLPTSTDQCKNGGWKTFGVFKNQGDCVSFVASKGRNPPSGP